MSETSATTIARDRLKALLPPQEKAKLFLDEYHQLCTKHGITVAWDELDGLFLRWRHDEGIQYHTDDIWETYQWKVEDANRDDS